MRVLFLANYFPKPTNTTMGTWALEQAQAFRRAGLEVRVRSYTSWFPKILAVHPGIRRYTDCPKSHTWDGLPVDYPRWPIYPFDAFNALMHKWPLLQLRAGWPFIRSGLFSVVEEFRPDIVFAHHTAPNGYLAMKIHRRYGIPYVITDHTYEDVDDAVKFPGRRRLYRAIGSGVSNMIGISKRMTQAHILVGVPPEKAITIFNGSDMPDRAGTAQERPAELHDKIVVTSVAMLYERKGFPLFVRAFARIAAKHPTAVLRIIGEGHERPKIEQAIRETGMESRVTLCGLQPRPRVHQELAWCDIFALVGWNEAWGVVYNEAMAAGKPILCANDGGINDVLINGENAVTVPPQDEAAAAAGLDRLLSDADLRARLGAAGRELFLSGLTWDANARQFGEIFAQAVKQQAAVAPTTS